MNILLLGNFLDHQTADYIAGSLEDTGAEKVHCIDIRRMASDFTPHEMQNVFLKEIENLDEEMDLVILLKGKELTLNTLKEMRVMMPNAIYVNWFFDVYLHDAPIWDTEKYFPVIDFFDFYFCSLKGVADKLREKGLDNVYYLDEGCFLPAHREVYMNNFQKKKYGTDVTFIGSLGFFEQHSERVKLLTKIATEGFDLAIWGPLLVDMKYIPSILRDKILDTSVVNEEHSKVVQSSLVNLGLDQDVTVDMGHSARAYRIMCAGGCYLSTATKGLDRMFKANGPEDEITADQEIVLFYSEDDLVQKIDFLLEHDDIREQIALNGQIAVIKNHTFKHRVNEMLEIINKEMIE